MVPLVLEFLGSLVAGAWPNLLIVFILSISMDLDIVFKGENIFEAGSRSKIAVSSHSNVKEAEDRVIHGYANGKDRDKKGRHLSTYGLIDNISYELFLYNPASPHRKSLPSRSIRIDLKDSGSLNRSSMHQSSKEVRRMHKVRGMKNVEPDISNNAFLSFEVVDSSPWDASKKDDCFLKPIKENVSSNLKPKSPSSVNFQLLPRDSTEFLDLSFRDLQVERSKISISCSDAAPRGSSSADSLFEICLPMEEISSLAVNEAPELVEELQVKEIKFCTHQLFSDVIDANIVYGGDSICILPKSSLVKIEPLSTSCHSGGILKSSSKTRFSTFKKLFDPIMKSKALHNPVFLEPQTSRSSASDVPSETQKIENFEKSNGSNQRTKKDASPAHLHAVLKWDPNHAAPLYEFSVKDPENVLRAKTWKTENAFNWVYTFHSCKKKSKSCSHGKNDRHDQLPPMIAQMQVSSYFRSEVSGAGNSAVTEFTLYDIAAARRRKAVEGDHLPLNSNKTAACAIACSSTAQSPSELNSLAETESYNCPVRRNSFDFVSEPSTSHPWTPGELKPNFEIAAIVIQTPFSKIGNLKNLQAGDKFDGGNQGLSNSSAAAQARLTIGNHSSLTEVKVVTPIGRHGLPASEEVGPSSILDRWRLGGGCDCGGWDMGCPIFVFDSVYYANAESIMGTRQPIVLLAKGKKEKIPALTITSNGKGEYTVDFHAQLSALQAFSICIAVLHGCEASSDPLKLLLEDEVRHIIGAVAEEENRNLKKRVEQVPPSFFLEPPFSPIARV